MKGNFFIKKGRKESAELEEVLLDFSNTEMEKIEDSFDNDKIKKIRKIFFLAIFFLALQAFYLQIIKGSHYANTSRKNYTRIIAVKSPRGIIYDKNFKQMVFNIPVFDLVVIPSDFFQDGIDLEEKENKIAEIAGIKKDDIKEKIEKADSNSNQPILIIENLNKEDALVMEEKIKEINGVILEKSSIRNYIDSSYFSNIIGYGGRISKEELEENVEYLSNDTIGKSGLEIFYEKELRGIYGKEEIEVDSFGKKIRMIRKESPQSGNNLVLNIDFDLQKKIYEEIEKMVNELDIETGAAAVAINPKNGAILALVSLPSYDNNLFAKGISDKEYSKLLNNNLKPLFNRTISGEYPPGSTIKPLMGVAALEEKIISPNRMIKTNGVIYVGSYRFLDWKVHGMVNLTKAIAQSCNVYFYAIGGGYGDIEGLGINRMKKYMNIFGLGNSLGIDIPGERSGLIPDKDWKKRIKNERWYIGDTYHVSIGQGDLLTTPLQITSYIAAIANNGKLFKPQIVDKIIDSKGNLIRDIEPKIIREDFVDLKNIQWVQKGMRENVLSGSGRLLYNLPVEAAGKTGTAQYAGKKTHAWYVSYAPYDDPEIALTILIEGGGEGHDAAVPIANEVLRWYFEKE